MALPHIESFTHAAGPLSDPPWAQLRYYAGNPATTSVLQYDGHTTPGFATSSTTTNAGVIDDANTYGNDQYVQGQLLTWGGFASGAWAYIILRGSGADATGKYYWFRSDSLSGAGHTEFGITWNDVFTPLRSFATTFVNSDLLRLELVGTVATCYKNGVSLGTYDTGGDTNKIASGSAGLGSHSSIAGIGVWEGGNLVGTSSLRISQPLAAGFGGFLGGR